MSQWNANPNDPSQYPNTVRPGDPVPEGSVVGNSPLWHVEPSVQATPPAPKPPKKKRHVGRTIALVVGGLFALLIVVSVLTPGHPDAKAPVTVTSQAGAPVAPKPAASSQPAATTQPSPRVTHKPAPKLTAGQEQAIGTAEDYLSMGTGFSKSGLIKQLEFEQFSKADATYAVTHVTVSWNEQAALSAKGYLDTQHFSRSGLIQQLEYEGFTHSQAVYGVNKAGL